MATSRTACPTILLTAALVDAPTKTQTYDGSTVESQVRARAESILTALGYGTYGRYEIEQRVGGNPPATTAPTTPPGSARRSAR